MTTPSRLGGAAILAALLAAPAPRAAAQAPVVTPAGDPSVRADSIYRLAADSAKYPGQSTLVLLDDGIVRLQADGRATSTYRQIVQILRHDAVERYAEQSFGWVPGRQTMRLNWIRVVRPDGSVVSAKPSQSQDSDVPAEMSDPVYSDQRVRRLSLSGVAVGTIVDYSYTIEDTKPFPTGDHFGSWSVSMGVPVRRSRLVVDAPADVPLTLVETNLNFQRRETTAGGRRTYTWAAADVPKVEGQTFASDSNGVFMNLAYALPRTWADIGRWYATLSKDRYALGAAARARVKQAVAGARTRDDSVRALHRWVAQDVRYVSIALGVGGYRPRTPDEVVATGYGDCKDKATLFIAALRDWGMRAHPVILRAGRVDRRLPSVAQFNHAIAAIEDAGVAGGYRYVDLTASLTPYGELPYAPQGEFALVVRDDGRVDEVTLPIDPAPRNHAVTRVTGALSADGTFDGRYEETGTGTLQYALREALATPLDSTARVQAARAIASRIFPGTAGDSVETTPGRDLATPPRLAVRLRGGRATSKAGTTVLLNLPLGTLEGMATLADQIESQGARRFTIDGEAVLGNMERESEFRVTLPAGWTAQLPQSVHATSVFGEFHSEYAQEGRDLVVRRRVRGGRGIQAPDKAGELTTWLRAMAKEDTKFVVLQPPT